MWNLFCTKLEELKICSPGFRSRPALSSGRIIIGVSWFYINQNKSGWGNIVGGEKTVYFTNCFTDRFFSLFKENLINKFSSIVCSLRVPSINCFFVLYTYALCPSSSPSLLSCCFQNIFFCENKTEILYWKLPACSC